MSQLLDLPTAIPLPEAPAAPARQPRPRRHRPTRPEVDPFSEPRKERPAVGDLEQAGGPGAQPLRIADADPIEAAHDIAKRLHASVALKERIAIYKETGERFGSEYRRILNIAAACWPELIPMVNDLPEWKALLSADLS